MLAEHHAAVMLLCSRYWKALVGERAKYREILEEYLLQGMLNGLRFYSAFLVY